MLIKLFFLFFRFFDSIQVKESLKNLILSNDQVQRVGEAFKQEMSSALDEKTSSLQMENTYIPELPNGTENGTYLALDLGGTNFRIILLELADGEFLKEEFKFYHISDEARLGCGISLFGYLAECVKDFMTSNNMPVDMKIPMGFTFSFPMKQHSLHSAELVTWTKSFNCPSVVGCDVVQLLQSSLQKHGMRNIEVLCILNDTTGTLVIYDSIPIMKSVLMATFASHHPFFFSFFVCQWNNQVEGARLDNKTRIGMILGTGSNAAFLERADRVHHWEGERHGEKNVIIDIEWGAFGDKGTKLTYQLLLASKDWKIARFDVISERCRVITKLNAYRVLFLLLSKEQSISSELNTTRRSIMDLYWNEALRKFIVHIFYLPLIPSGSFAGNVMLRMNCFIYFRVLSSEGDIFNQNLLKIIVEGVVWVLRKNFFVILLNLEVEFFDKLWRFIDKPWSLPSERILNASSKAVKFITF